MLLEMNQDLRKKMEAWIEKIQEMFNENLEELMNKQAVINNSIIDIKNTL